MRRLIQKLDFVAVRNTTRFDPGEAKTRAQFGEEVLNNVSHEGADVRMDLAFGQSYFCANESGTLNVY